MPRNGYMSVDEKENIFRLLQSGYTGSQIHDMTGRSVATIKKLRQELQKAGFDIWHRGSSIAKSIPVAVVDESVEPMSAEIPATIEIPEPMMLEPQKPKKIPSLVLTRKTARFSGKCTGFSYVVDSNSDDLIIRDDGQEFRISFNLLEKFATEMVDIATEHDELKKSLED